MPSDQKNARAIGAGVMKRLYPESIVLAPILILYIGIAFYRIGHQSFWGDEIASIYAAQSESLFTAKLWSSGHGPLYFVLLYFWTQFGQTEFAVRSLSATLGLVAVCLVYALGLRLGDRRLAAVAATLFATSPFLIWYSQETRYVTLAITMVLLSMYSLQRALTSESVKCWLSYALSTAAALFAFVPNVFVAMSQGAYILGLGRRRLILRWIGYLSGGMLVFGIWLAIIYGGASVAQLVGSSRYAEREPIATLDTGTPRKLSAAVVPYTFLAFSGGFSLGPSVEELHLSRDLASVARHVPILALPTLLFGSLFLFGIVQLYRQTPAALFLLLWVAMPILGVLVISATTNVVYNVRYAAAAMPAYILILAAGITSARGRAVWIMLLLAVLSINAWSLSQYYFNPRYSKADARAAAGFLESAGGSRDVILFVGNSEAFRYYYRGNLPIVTWGREITNSQGAIAKDVIELNSRYDRLWFVSIRPWETDPNRNVKSVLEQAFKKTRVAEFPGATVAAYVHNRNDSMSLPSNQSQ